MYSSFYCRYGFLLVQRDFKKVGVLSGHGAYVEASHTTA